MKDFEVRFEGELPATPREVWDAITLHTSGWYWNISYEPRPGGAERGLTSAGGTVTAWEPPRHFATRAERPTREQVRSLAIVAAGVVVLVVVVLAVAAGGMRSITRAKAGVSAYHDLPKSPTDLRPADRRRTRNQTSTRAARAKPTDIPTAASTARTKRPSRSSPGSGGSQVLLR